MHPHVHTCTHAPLLAAAARRQGLARRAAGPTQQPGHSCARRSDGRREAALHLGCNCSAWRGQRGRAGAIRAVKRGGRTAHAAK
eukprot:358767-Chlamydomonas_euryale.AAC.3